MEQTLLVMSLLATLSVARLDSMIVYCCDLHRHKLPASSNCPVVFERTAVHHRSKSGRSPGLVIQELPQNTISCFQHDKSAQWRWLRSQL